MNSNRLDEEEMEVQRGDWDVEMEAAAAAAFDPTDAAVADQAEDVEWSEPGMHEVFEGWQPIYHTTGQMAILSNFPKRILPITFEHRVEKLWGEYDETSYEVLEFDDVEEVSHEDIEVQTDVQHDTNSYFAQKVSSLLPQLDAATTRAAELEAAVKDREIYISCLEDDFDSVLEWTNRAVNQGDQARENNWKIKKEMKEKEQFIAELISQLDAAVTRNADVEAALDDKEFEVADLHNELASWMDRANQAEEERKAETAELEKLIEEQNRMIMGEKEKTKDAKAEAALLRKTNAELQAANQNLRATILSLQSPIRSKQTPRLMEREKSHNEVARAQRIKRMAEMKEEMRSDNHGNSKNVKRKADAGTPAIDMKKSKVSVEEGRKGEVKIRKTDGKENSNEVGQQKFVEFAELSPEAEALCDRVWQNGTDAFLAEQIIDGFNPLTRNDLNSLYDSNWLCGVVISDFLRLINDRSVKNSTLPKAHAFDTYFYSTITNPSLSFEQIRRRSKKIELFEQDILLFPTHLRQSHWTLLAVNFNRKKIEYYDSLRSMADKEMEKGIIENVKNFLLKEAAVRRVSLDFTGWEEEWMKDIPQQANGSGDCGVFACYFAERLSRNAPINFNSSHMSYLRKRMMYQLFKHDLSAS